MGLTGVAAVPFAAWSWVVLPGAAILLVVGAVLLGVEEQHRWGYRGVDAQHALRKLARLLVFAALVMGSSSRGRMGLLLLAGGCAAIAGVLALVASRVTWRTDQQIIDALLFGGLDDWVSLHEVVGESTRGRVSDTGKATVVRVLTRVCVDDLLVPGDLAGAGFVDWPPPVEGWPARCEAELERLGWAPMGDGPWFRLTEEGERAARRITPPRLY